MDRITTFTVQKRRENRMSEQDRQDQIKKLHSELDAFLATVHDLDSQGCLVSPADDDWHALGNIFSKVLTLKFRPDCDRWLPVRFHFTDVKKHRRPYFKPMPRGIYETSGEWDAALKVALHNVKIAVGEYQQLQEGHPEAPGTGAGQFQATQKDVRE